MKKYDLILFDVDGTLLDTSEGIISSVSYIVEKYGLISPDSRTLKSFIGPPMQESFTRVFGMDKERAMELAIDYRVRYSKDDLLKATPYDGIYDVMEYLKKNGKKYSIATYKRQDYAEKIMREFGFFEGAVSVIGADFDYKLKKKDIIEKCVREAGITDLKRVLMIGDTVYDADGAKAAGVDFLGVFYGFGFRNKEDLKQVKNVGGVNTPREIIDFLERI
ncbi:MAG: HAD hydrolase-like protein [Clostridia bacterium]|nr:HAD hydrolase-like protein [Clostridia bacterium]